VVGLIQEMRDRYPGLDPARVDDIVLGVVSPIGDQGSDIAKTAAIAAGLPDTVAGVQLNRFCASGLEAVNIAAQKVRSGWEDLVLAGGVESMSRVPMGSDGGAWALDPETNYDTGFVPQGVGADLIATIEGFSREDVDNYAAQSQARAAKAWLNGYFSRSVVPVRDRNGMVVLDRDEHMRPETTVETLGGLPASFDMIGELGGFDAVALQKYHWVERIEHVHTAGNSSGIVDGASLVLVGSARAGAEAGLTPRARIVAAAVSGADPTIMLTGPAPATRKALGKAGLSIEDIDLVEMNEAFAAVVLRFARDMDLSLDKVNVNGGAIAMGHPLGATGGMLLGTLLDELERRELRYGLATLCIGGGMGIATIIERI
jgi:acetyl-CoA C-acetyltransferase